MGLSIISWVSRSASIMKEYIANDRQNVWIYHGKKAIKRRIRKD